jgi:hypothetical protein
MNHKSQADLELLYLWCKEGWVKSVLGEYHEQKEALSRFFIGASALSEPVLKVIRQELRRVSPEVRIDTDQIKAVLVNEVIKREVLEGEKADNARRKLAKAAGKALKASAKENGKPEAEAACAVEPAVAIAAAPPAV